jgi:predicted outer membrane protein
MIRALVLLSAASVLAAGLWGCGSQSDPSTGASGRVATAQSTADGSASITTAVLPAPRKSRAASAGRRACQGRTPRQVRQRYEQAAAAHANAADRRFLRSVVKQGGPTTVPLAARLYSMTVSKSSLVDAFSACAHVLSLKESLR